MVYKVYCWYDEETIPSVNYSLTRELAEEHVRINSRTGHRFKIENV